MGQEDVQWHEQPRDRSQNAPFGDRIRLCNCRLGGHKVKASANYINISEAFARGIVVFNNAVDWEHLSHVYNPTSLQQLTMRLYAKIFSYLIKFMTWFTGRSRMRFLKSFNGNTLVGFEQDLDQAKQVSTLLSRQIQLHVSTDSRISKLLLADLSGDMRYLVKFA